MTTSDLLSAAEFEAGPVRLSAELRSWGGGRVGATAAARRTDPPARGVEPRHGLARPRRRGRRSRLSVWEGESRAGAGNPFVTSDAGARPWRLGDKLHLALVTARIPETAGKSFQPDVLYSYDVAIKRRRHDAHPAVAAHAARRQGRGVARRHRPRRPRLRARRAPELRPAALAAIRPAHPLRLVPAARATATRTRWCGSTTTSTATVDDPRARPHQLFLGGDQIYADDVDTLMMFGLMDLGDRADRRRRRRRRRSIERRWSRSCVDKVMRRSTPAAGPSTRARQRPRGLRRRRRRPGRRRALPIDKADVPAGPPARADQAGGAVHELRRQQPPDLASASSPPST